MYYRRLSRLFCCELIPVQPSVIMHYVNSPNTVQAKATTGLSFVLYLIFYMYCIVYKYTAMHASYLLLHISLLVDNTDLKENLQRYVNRAKYAG